MQKQKIDLMVENFFKPVTNKKDNELTIDDLISIINEVKSTLPSLVLEAGQRMNLGGPPIDQFKAEKSSDSESGEKQMSIKVPVIKITERWGKLREGAGGKDREIIETFTKNIGGGSVKEKLSNVSNVIKTFDPEASIPKILSTIVFLELLRSIVQEYTEAVSGFLFEGFLAGIFGGQSVQITDVESGEGEGQKGKPITDVVLNGKLYSLKLLSLTTGIHGSFENMVEHMAQYGQIIYLIVRKSDDKGTLQFSEFEITLDNFLTYIGFGEEKVTKSKALVQTMSGAELKTLVQSPTNMVLKVVSSTATIYRQKGESEFDASSLNDEEQYEVSYAQSELKLSGAGKKLYGSEEMYNRLMELQKGGDKEEFIKLLRATPGYKNRSQWTIPPKYAERNSVDVGTLDLSDETVRGIAEKYAELLQNSLIPIYTKLDEVGNAVNSYFLGVESNDVSNKQYATIAAQKSKELAQATETITK